jgi:hypothetical protein
VANGDRYPVGFDVFGDNDPTEKAGFELRRKLEFEDDPNLRGLLKLSDYQLGRVVEILRDKR